MNAIAKTEQTAIATMGEAELMTVLQSSLYPGAATASIKMVLGYCKAAGLDPMLKPVHIVPMWDGKAKQMRDVVMPGVGLYRTQAARTGAFAGQTEPEFGPMITTKLGGQEISYPEWARVTVKKSMPNGQVAEFTAVEYWIENYAVKGGAEKSSAPNAMWLKRPRGQIAKCAAAQALRLAFPEGGAQPTAEEMEGKALDDDYTPAATVIDAKTGEVVGAKEKPILPGYTDEQFITNMATWRKVIASGKKKVDEVLATVETMFTLTDDQVAAIKAIPAELVKAAGERKPEGRTGPGEAPAVTYAQCAEALNKATDMDILNDAATLINAIENADQQRELNAMYDQRAKALNQ